MQVQNHNKNQTQKTAPGRPGRPVGSRNTPPRGMVDVRGLSEMLGLSAATIRRNSSISPWKLPPRVIWPGKMLWSISVVDAWLAQRTPELPSASPMDTAPAPSQGIDLSTAFAVASVPTKAPGRGRPRGSKSVKPR